MNGIKYLLGINFIFVVAIAEKISAMETAQFFEKRTALVVPGAADTAWGKVGALAAMPGDEWTAKP